MKKVLLFAVSAIALSASAQTLTEGAPVVNIGAQKAATMKAAPQQAFSLESRAKKPRRSALNGVYYSRPAGSLYSGSTDEGYGYYISPLVVAPYSLVSFPNHMSDVSKAIWTLNGTDYSTSVDENGAWIFGYAPAYSEVTYSSGTVAPSAWYLPTLSDGTYTYQLGESNKNFSQYGPGSLMVDGLAYHAFYNSGTSSSYGFGAVSEDGYPNMFGTGEITLPDGNSYPSAGFTEVFPAPTSPLYVEQIAAQTLDLTDTPIPAGKELTMIISNVEKDDEGNDVAGSEQIAVLKATADDVINWYSYDYSSNGWGYRYGNRIIFKQTELDSFGDEVITPFTISGKFAVTVVGCEQDGVSVNFSAVGECDEDNLASQAGEGKILIAYQDGYVSVGGYQSPALADLEFYSCFDYVEVWDAVQLNDGTTVDNFNVLTIPAAGTTTGDDVVNKGYPTISYTQAEINFDWEDESGVVNYLFLDTPDWFELAGETIESESSTSSKYAALYVSYADALPEGVTGRGASVYVEGKGYQSAAPVIVLQGDATIADAIKNPVYVNADAVNNKTYNLNGQVVGKNFKGIVIKNGKKTVQK